MYLRYWSWYRALYGTGRIVADRSDSDLGFHDHRVWFRELHRACRELLNGLSGVGRRWKVGSQWGVISVVVREGPKLANRRDRPRRPLKFVRDLRIAWPFPAKLYIVGSGRR